LIKTRIESVGVMSQLGDEIIVSYDTGPGRTVTNLITALFAMQESANPITVGTIEPTGIIAVEIENTDILTFIMKLREIVGGYISVNADKELDWLNDIGEDKGQQIRYRKNLVGISRIIDYGAPWGNRLYCYGAGEGDAKIKLSDAEGQTEDYVEDTDSQAIYGVISRALRDPSITHPDTLLAWANQKLDELSLPLTTYRINAVDLAARDARFDFDKLELGSIITIIDEDLEIDVEARVIKISRSDLNGEVMEIEVANRTKDVLDLFSEPVRPHSLSYRCRSNHYPGVIHRPGLANSWDNRNHWRLYPDGND